ncbi:MAG: hypothetical protein KDK62_06210 [Chlamydiia bacterium]|nr:hypothetical protein [Chlamydiia bacterium]
MEGLKHFVPNVLFVGTPYSTVRAGLGAATGAVLNGGMGAAIGAGIGGAAELIAVPGHYLLDGLAYAKEGEEPTISKSTAAVLKLVNTVACHTLVWGGACALGVISAPVAIAGGLAVGGYAAISTLENVALEASGDLSPLTGFLTVSVKVAFIAGAILGLTVAGFVAPPIGISLAVAAVVLAIVGTTLKVGHAVGIKNIVGLAALIHLLLSTPREDDDPATDDPFSETCEGNTYWA